MSVTPRRPAPSHPSLYGSGLPARLLVAAGMAALVWLAIAWALGA